MSRWIRQRLRAVRRDSGQTSFEYLGIAVVVAVIIGVLAGTTDIGQAVLDGILSQINEIVDAG